MDENILKKVSGPEKGFAESTQEAEMTHWVFAAKARNYPI